MHDRHPCPACDATLDHDAQYCCHCGYALAVTGKTITLPSPGKSPRSQIRPSSRLFFLFIFFMVSGWFVAGIVLGHSSSMAPQVPTIATPYPLATTLPHVLIPTRAASFSSLDLNVQTYPTFTLYWQRDLWESTLSTDTITEDFSLDAADYGEVSFPFLTGHSLLLQGQSNAQILGDTTLLGSGNLLHFRDWKEGLHVQFPDNQPVEAFGFEYRSNETWQLQVMDTIITLPHGRKSFLGIDCHTQCPRNFILVGASGAQGGLSIDNIRFVPLTAAT